MTAKRPCQCDRVHPDGLYVRGRDCSKCYLWHHNAASRQAWEVKPTPSPNNYTYTPTAKERAIPLVFHRVWVGGQSIPKRFDDYWQTWRKHHPDATFRTWGDADIPSLGEYCVRLCAQARNPAERSDVLRFYIIAQHGGLYLDTDFECVKSITPLLDGWELVTAWENGDMLASAFFGAVPNHPALRRMVEYLDGANIDPTRTQMKTAGPRKFTEVLGEPTPGMVYFPSAWFYSLKYEDRHRDYTPPPHVFAVHWWSHTWEEWWATVTFVVLGGELANCRDELGAGDVVTDDLTAPLRTTHVCRLTDQLAPGAVRRIRETLRKAPHYAEMDFVFPGVRVEVVRPSGLAPVVVPMDAAAMLVNPPPSPPKDRTAKCEHMGAIIERKSSCWRLCPSGCAKGHSPATHATTCQTCLEYEVDV